MLGATSPKLFRLKNKQSGHSLKTTSSKARCSYKRRAALLPKATKNSDTKNPAGSSEAEVEPVEDKDEKFEKLPGWVKGEKLVAGTDIRMIDITTGIAFVLFIAYNFRKSLL
eukprot:CAMPEP_0196587696 /NCGR_PEP_ID=MMETSP1081-20130531/58322_1 /TAXON_ID=36882 /ORGANISM="Pyramimonas amylifera, Strain CCMP720" /LENGTH=111 /DNA_ID=CAMNT_0041909949 /DNA_START=70 /DNA_END=405 /DNA_ORIENTATION=+